MPKAEAPSRTALKGTLDFMSKERGLEISIPVYVYKKNAELKKADAHLHHAKDKGSIVYRKYCTECDKEISNSDIIKMVDMGSDLVPISTNDVKETYNKTGTSMVALRTVSLKSFANDVMNNLIMPREVYSIRGFRPDKKNPPVPSHEITLRTMLAALEANNEGLMLSACLDSIQRNAILFPSGDIWTLSWAEEVREDIDFHTDELDKTMLNGWKKFFKSKEESLHELESQTMSEEIANLLESKLPKKAMAKAEPEKKASVAKVSEKLAEMMGEKSKK